MKKIALTVFPVLLALICVFCAVFSIFMAARPERSVAGEDEREPDASDTQSGADTETDPDTSGDNTDDTDPPDKDENDTTSKKRIAITLDDGPYHKYQRRFIDEMKKYGGAATFFVVGNRVNWNEATLPGLAYAHENGWEIGIHAWTHENDKFFDVCSDEVYNFEIQQTASIIQKYIPGYDIRLLRPPGGQITSARAESSPYAIIRWDVDSYDYKYSSSSNKEANVQAIVDNVMAQARDGSIILMHELYENSYLAYCEILKTLDAQGYEFVTVSELLGDKYQAGKTFTNGR